METQRTELELLADFRVVVEDTKKELTKVSLDLAALRARGAKGGQRLDWLTREEARLVQLIPLHEELLRKTEERLNSKKD